MKLHSSAVYSALFSKRCPFLTHFFNHAKDDKMGGEDSMHNSVQKRI